MAKKLYVGNLSYDSTEAQIRELFAQVGEITEVNVIMDRDTGRSKGFAFVQMVDDTAATVLLESEANADGSAAGTRDYSGMG